MFPGSSEAELRTVNALVGGSIPSQGAMKKIKLYDTLYHIPEVDEEVLHRGNQNVYIVAAVGNGYVDVLHSGETTSYLIPDFAAVFDIYFEPILPAIKAR